MKRLIIPIAVGIWIILPKNNLNGKKNGLKCGHLFTEQSLAEVFWEGQ